MPGLRGRSLPMMIAMTSEPENLTLTLLRRLDEKVDRLIAGQRELTQRVGTLEEQGASLSRRLDRVHDRLDRIERRLELADHPAE